MNTLRRPAVAGSFYPDRPEILRKMIWQFLNEAELTGGVPKALIAPHAGYIYSGPIAATAYKRLMAARDRIKRVVLLGPSHRVGFEGLALSSADAFLTPLGTIPIDKDAYLLLAHLPQVFVFDQAHLREHSLEVHLPFLQEVLSDFKLVPISVGEASPETVSGVLEALWGGDETLIVISSDLSHFYDYESARTMDAATSKAIEALRPEDIGHDQACGQRPVNGLLVSAKKHHLHAKTVDLRNSGDTAGSKDEVVGYGAYVFEP